MLSIQTPVSFQYYGRVNTTDHDEEMQPIQHIHNLSALLAQGYRAEFVSPKRLDDDTIQLGWYNYDLQIWDGIEAANMLLGADYNYQENVDAVRDKSVSSALPGDLSTWFTWMSRGERFCDGFLAEQISDGGLYAVVKRLEELIAAGEVSYPPEATRKQ